MYRSAQTLNSTQEWSSVKIRGNGQVLLLSFYEDELKIHQIYTLGNDYLKFLTHLTWVIALTEFSMRK